MNEDVIKAVGLFGGGVAGSGHTCGALLGGIAALAGVYSRGNLDEKESPIMRQVGGRLVRKFEELTATHGGINCHNIAQVDWTDPESVHHFRNSPDSRRSLCVALVGETAHALGELIDQPPKPEPGVR